MLKVNLKQVHIKDYINPKNFIGFYLGCVGFMMSQNMIDWWNTKDSGFLLFLWMSVWAIALILGITKPGTIALFLQVLSVIQNEQLSLGQRIALIRELVHTAIPMWVNLEELFSMENKEKNEEVKLPEPL